MTRPNPLASDGLPYVFDEFDVTGQVDDKQWYADDSPVTDTFRVIETNEVGAHRLELQLDLRVVTFPEPD